MTRFDGPISGEKISVIVADGPRITIPDPDLLFSGHYSRSGHDLVLTGDDGKSAVILDYFSQATPPALESPEGATLAPHVVSALAGPMAPGQYAQAGDQQPAASIGKVVTLEGSATAQRTDGTVVQLNVGDQVAQGDVLQTAQGGALGLVFTDGTVFSLTSNSRMVLDNLVYQAGGQNNSLTFNVVEGTFSFVAGQVAPTGEMRIETPVATLGIRGTTPGGICATGGPCTFFIAPDPGTNHVGSFLLLGSAGQVLQTVNNPAFQYTVSASGALVTEPLDPSTAEIINKLIQAFERRASEGEDEKEGEDGSGPNGGTDTANSGGSGIESFSATSATDSAIQTGLPTDGIESLTEETSEETTETTTTASTSSTTTTTGTTTGDTGTDNNPPNQPDGTISDDTGSTVEDGGGTTGTVDASGNVIPQTGTEGTFGTFAIDQDGNWTYTLNDNAQALNEGDVAQDIFTVTTEDGATATVAITVTGTNDAPVAVGDEVVGEFATSTTFTAAELLANDTDVDNPNSALSIAGVTSGTGGTAVLNLDGSVTFTPDEGFSGTATFTYTVTDGTDTSTPVTVNVTVEGNDPPTASPVTLDAVAEDSGGRLITQAELLAGVSDPDSTSLTITSLSIAEGSGSLIDNGNGTWTYTPAANDDTGVTFNYTVSDGTSSDSSTASLDITPQNDAPTASPVTLTAIAEDSGGRLITQAELLAGVTDPDGPSLTVTSLSIAEGSGLLVDNGNGTWTYTPAADDDTGVTFNYTVSDGTSTDSSTASLDITPQSDAPTASPVTLAPIAEESGDRLITQAELLAGVSDPDGPSLTITELEISEGSGLLIDNGNGTWTYMPAANDDTGVTFNYTVSDGTSTDSSTASLDITPVNDPPLLTGDLEADINTSGSYVLTTSDLGFTDVDDADVVFTVSDLLNGEILVDGEAATSFTYADIQSGLVSFQHDGSETSEASFDVSVEDGNEDGSTPESQTFTLHVTNYITGTEGPDNDLDGTAAVDVINGLGGGDIITGNGDDDTLIGGAGADTYVWNAGDGYDTVVGDNANEDVVRIEGGPFYDYNYEIDGDDLLVGVAADGDYEWADVGGNVRIENFFSGSDTIAYLQADLGDLNTWYNPGGEGADARIYFSKGTGTDQGNYYEVILGTEAGETITDTGGTWINRLNGYGGDDTLIAANSGPSVLVGGNGNDTLIGGTNDDELRGGSGNDDIDGGLGGGYDVLAYHRPATSGEFTHGVFVNLSSVDASGVFLGQSRTVEANHALDNWWNPSNPTVGVDTIQNVEAVIGTQFDDIIIGGDDALTIAGGGGSDFLDGGGGEGSDTVDYYPPFGSPAVTQGVFVNISSEAATFDFNGDLDVTVGPGQALDNWGNSDTIANFENIYGSDLDDVLVAGSDYNYIDGRAGDDVIVGGGGYDTLVGGEGSDSFVFGTEWGETWINDFELGTDLLRFQGDVGIYDIEVVDAIYDELGDYDSTLVTLTNGATVLLAGVTDIEDISQLIAPPITGDTGPNEIDGTVFNDVIEGGQGDDTLNGRAGVDTYIWSADDGYDTIAANNDNEDIIQIVGTFYDYNFQIDGDDVLIGVAADDDYDFADVGGSLRLEDYLLGNDSIAYLEADLGDNDQYYSPEGGDSRIYLSLLQGTDQGPYYELILGTGGNDVMTDVGGGGVNRFLGYGGDDTITAADGARATLLGGDGDDSLYGADHDDDLRGGKGNDVIDGGGQGDDGDIVRYDRPATSGPYTHGVVVNLSDQSIVLSGDPGEGEYSFNGMNGTVESNQAIGNWENLATWASNPETRIDTDTLSNIENVRGSTFDDVLIGSDGDNTIIGDQGSDTIIAGGGNDFIVASFGSDYIDGGTGDYDQVWYGGLDGVYVSLADGYADEGDGVIDTLVDINAVGGSDGDDTLIGDAESNYFTGLAGNDYIDGGYGNDAIDYYGDPNGVIVNLEEGTATDGWGNTDTLVSIEDIWGSFEYGDELTGNFSANFIQGRGGDDTIRGYGGNDYLVGGEGFDIFVFGSQNDYTDTAQIEDFVVGTDFLRLEDGVSLNDIEEWDVGDFNGDDILDTRITIIDSENFEDGYIELLGVSGVTDVNDLLEPQNLFSMAFMASEDETSGEDTMFVAGASERSAGDFEELGSDEEEPRFQWKRGDEARNFEISFAQAAAAVAGAVMAAPQILHAAEASLPEFGSNTQHATAQGDSQGWIGETVANRIANLIATQHGIEDIVTQPAEHGSQSGLHGSLDITSLRHGEDSTPERQSTPDTDRDWNGAAHRVENAGSDGPSKRPSVEHEAPVQTESQGHANAPSPEPNGLHGADVASPSGPWSHANLFDAGPYLDLSGFSIDGILGHALPKGVAEHATINLPAFDAVIDLRHDLFAEISQVQKIADRNPGELGEARFGGENLAFAGQGIADFVHNLANDLEAAVQNHDAR
jgi:VCBS repeat-containing protein